MTTENKNPRWVQRFENYKKAFEKLEKAIELATQRELSIIEKTGVINYFLKCYSLQWKTIKDFYEYQGELDIQGARDSFELAFQRGLCSDDLFFSHLMRNLKLVSEIYETEIVEQLFHFIVENYFYSSQKINANLEKQVMKMVKING